MADLDKHVRLYDPAIDWTEGSGTPREWPRTRREADLRIKPAKKPTVFHSIRLGRSAMRWAREAANDDEILYRCFRSGVRRVEKADGSTWSPQGVDDRDFVAMTEAEADVFGYADHLEIGGLIYEGSRLPFDCAASFTLRPMSLAVWDAQAQASQRAAQSQDVPRATANAPEGS